MKKILIATSALAFASSAFAADVSGYALSALKKTDTDQSLYSETEVYFSSSKTATNGLTFGATYTIGFDGTSNTSTIAVGTPTAADPTLAIVTAVADDGVAAATTGIEAAPSGTSRNDYANINAFVSGSFGKVEMGTHDSASKALGVASISAGSSISGSITGDETRTTVDNAITYTSPKFSGLQVAYSYILDNTNNNAFGVKYTTNALGWGIAIAHGESNVEKTYANTYSFKTATTGVEVSRGGFSVSYAMGTTGSVGTNAVEGTVIGGGITDVSGDPLFPEVEYSRIGVGYTMNKWNVSAVRAKTADIRTDDLYLSYDLVNGLTVFGESVTTGEDKTLYLGTNISF